MILKLMRVADWINAMIRKKSETSTFPIVIDLTVPKGNAFFLLGLAQELARRLGYDKKTIKNLIERMKASDYESLVKTFDDEFGDFVILER